MDGYKSAGIVFIIIGGVVITLILIGLVWFYIIRYTPFILMHMRLGGNVRDTQNTKASAAWLSPKDISIAVSKKIFTMDKGVVLGCLVNPNEIAKKAKDLVIKLGNHPRFNKHVGVIASSGAGKTFSFVYTTILNIIELGDSYFASDPKGEVYELTAAKAEEAGFFVVLLNFIEMFSSMRFNIFDYIKKRDKM